MIDPCVNPLCGNHAASNGDLCEGCQENWDAIYGADCEDPDPTDIQMATLYLDLGEK
jgi:hypothetical protein